MQFGKYWKQSILIGYFILNQIHWITDPTVFEKTQVMIQVLKSF